MRLGEASSAVGMKSVFRAARVLDGHGELIETISPNDEMYQAEQSYYFVVGEVAVKYIYAAMLICGVERCLNVLDLASGHGRVMRALKAAFPEAGLTACDVDEDAIEFCADVFGATPVVSRKQPKEIAIDGSFDLIWSGSLFTHLDVDGWDAFLGFCESRLRPGGLLVFTVHGRFPVDRLRRRVMRFGMAEQDIDGMIAAYDDGGFGYSDYPHLRGEGWGISLSSPAWVSGQLAALRSLQVVSYTEAGPDRGWAGQDVVACVRLNDALYDRLVDTPPAPGKFDRLK